MDKWKVAEEKLKFLDELIDKYGDVKVLFGMPLRRIRLAGDYETIKYSVEKRVGNVDKVNKGLDTLIKDVLNVIEGRMKEIVITDEANLRGKQCIIRPVCFDSPKQECIPFYYPVWDHEIGEPEDLGIKAKDEKTLIRRLSEQSYTRKCVFVDPDFNVLYDLERGEEVFVTDEAKKLIESYRDKFAKLKIDECSIYKQEFKDLVRKLKSAGPEEAARRYKWITFK